MVIYTGFTHWTWWFSIVMLVYPRVVEDRDGNRCEGFVWKKCGETNPPRVRLWLLRLVWVIFQLPMRITPKGVFHSMGLWPSGWSFCPLKIAKFNPFCGRILEVYLHAHTHTYIYIYVYIYICINIDRYIYIHISCQEYHYINTPFYTTTFEQVPKTCHI